jgi:dienelactone hydrolase
MFHKAVLKCILAATVGLSAALCGHSEAAETNVPLEVFGNLPSIEDMALSPDATKIAYARTTGTQRSVLVRKLDEAQPLAAFRVGDTKLRSVQWVDERHLLLTRSRTAAYNHFSDPREWFQLAIYDLGTQTLKDMNLAVPGERMLSVFYGSPTIRQLEGTPTVFVHGTSLAHSGGSVLLKYAVPTARTYLAASGDHPSTYWLVDDAGSIAAEFAGNDNRDRWEISIRSHGSKQVVASGKIDIESPALAGFSPDGGSVVVESTENSQHVWKMVSLKDGTWSAPQTGILGILTDRRTQRMTATIPEGNERELKFLDAELQAHWDAATRVFPNESVQLVAAADDFSKLLVRVFGQRDGYRYALFDWNTHGVVLLPTAYDGLTQVAEVRPIQYAAADGTQIPAVLTVPPGTASKSLALIVLPHGGPAAADGVHFDWWAQALASRGYVVLQPNYRGSTLSRAFVEAGFGEWGKKMQTDLSDGVRYLAEQGMIDPKRVCIVGASYGGYAALAGVTLQSGIYRCAVSVAGIADMTVFLRRAGFENSYIRYLDRFLGTSGHSNADIAKVSPIEHVGAVTAPILLMHGRDDTVVAFEQSELMEAALRRSGKSVRFVTLKNEDHWLSHGETRLQMLEESVRFLKEHNPP